MILRPGDAGVAVRAADDEAPGRVDVDLGVLVHRSLRESTRLMIFSTMSSRIVSLVTSGLCWLETTTASTRTGVLPSYSTVTCDLPSGRR